MVTVQFKGGMGNQMFQYSVGRIIAEGKGYQLEIADPDKRQHMLFDGFKNTGVVEGKEVRATPMVIGPDLQYFDMNAVMGHQGHIILHGYWQKHYYYTPHMEKIRKWFVYDDSQYEKPDKDDIVVLVRLDDYVRDGFAIPARHYIDVINKMGNYNRCIVQTDSPDSPLLDEFKSLKNVVIKHKDTMSDFTMLKCAKRLVLSQSSFGWWAAMLGTADVVYVPLTASGNKCLWRMCPAVQDIDLVPFDNNFVIFKI